VVDERRKQERIKVVLRATVFWGWGEALGETRDVSATGALLRLEGPVCPEPGTALELHLRVPGSAGLVRCAAVVRWTMRQTPPLVGVELGVPLSEVVLDAIAEHAQGPRRTG